ncbi:MAG: transglutaminase-like domain-containing protein [Oscillospiraceae bacterium]|nr:transglutaminase-like domain-containing protein [Oscillospiraceae bacterium]
MKRKYCVPKMLGCMLFAFVVMAAGFYVGAPYNVNAVAVKITDNAVPLSSGIKLPATGSKKYSGGSATIDVSNASDGYIMAKFTGSKAARIRLTRSGKTTYTYRLRSDGAWETFPLSSGSGRYNIEVLRNVSGNSYSWELTQSIEVKLDDPYGPFLYPNQFVNFNAKSKAVEKGAELAKGGTNQLEIISKVYNFVIGTVQYDNAKAKKVSAGDLAGYVPDLDQVLKTNKGICFDYAALMAGMLRSQGIPTRMEFGYVSGGVYHAWLSVFLEERGWVNNVIQFDGKSWSLMDPTFASSQGANSQYVGKGSNYQVKFLY